LNLSASPGAGTRGLLLSAYWTGCSLVIAGGLALSLGVLCIRAANESDAWQYLFWRGLGFGCTMLLLAAWRHASNPFTQIRHLGGFAWVSVIAMVASQVLFVAAIKIGSTAEVFFLLALAPLMAALLARPLLGERIGPFGGLAIARRRSGAR
jgi:drug/metabolite transporter, DME family